MISFKGLYVWFFGQIQKIFLNSRIDRFLDNSLMYPAIDNNFYRKSSLKYSIVRSSRSRRMAVMISQHGNVVVRIPQRASEVSARKFFLQYEDKILKILSKKSSDSFRPSFNHNNKFEIYGYTVSFVSDNSLKSAKVITGNRTVLLGYDKNDILILYPSNDLQTYFYCIDGISKAVYDAIKVIALSILPKRLDELSKRFLLSYNKVTIKNVKTIWGSCSRSNNITLSSKLVLLPQNLIDYVILHELTHTKHKNHGIGFWNMLDSLVSDDSRRVDRLISKHKHPLESIM